ncbi:MAG: hypothetical protein FJ308_16525, partial [Planctomycetes bacterium]|nr:hypothetical protein [Planctomycetota bacterium]
MFSAKQLLQTVCWLTALQAWVFAQSSVTDRFKEWPIDLTIQGTVLVTDSPDGLVEWLKKPNPKRPGAGSPKESNWRIFGTHDLVDSVEQAISPFGRGVARCKSIQELSDASADHWVWCDERHPWQLPVEEIQLARTLLRQKIDSGGTVCLVGPIAALAGKFIASPSPTVPISSMGLNLIPDGLLLVPGVNTFGTDPIPAIKDPTTNRPVSLIEDGKATIAPDFKSVIVEVSRNTALVLRGRKLLVYGPGGASLHIAAGERLPARSHTIQDRSYVEREGPESWMADWTQWRREAIDRTLEP